MNFKNLWKGRASIIVLISLIINIIFIYAVQDTFELSSTITYILVGLILVGIIKNKRLDSAAFFMIGAAIPAIYNGLGHLFGFFSVTSTYFLIAILEQGVITWLVAKLHGVK